MRPLTKRAPWVTASALGPGVKNFTPAAAEEAAAAMPNPGTPGPDSLLQLAGGCCGLKVSTYRECSEVPRLHMPALGVPAAPCGMLPPSLVGVRTEDALS